jgi:hypothetical protein
VWLPLRQEVEENVNRLVEDKRLYLPFYGKRGPAYILVQGGSAYTKASHKGKSI